VTRVDSSLPGLDFVNPGILAKIGMYDKRVRVKEGALAGSEEVCSLCRQFELFGVGVVFAQTMDRPILVLSRRGAGMGLKHQPELHFACPGYPHRILDLNDQKICAKKVFGKGSR
jgi:hypothetical protein